MVLFYIVCHLERAVQSRERQNQFKPHSPIHRGSSKAFQSQSFDLQVYLNSVVLLMTVKVSGLTSPIAFEQELVLELGTPSKIITHKGEFLHTLINLSVQVSQSKPSQKGIQHETWREVRQGKSHVTVQPMAHGILPTLQLWPQSLSSLVVALEWRSTWRGSHQLPFAESYHMSATMQSTFRMFCFSPNSDGADSLENISISQIRKLIARD